MEYLPDDIVDVDCQIQEGRKDFGIKESEWKPLAVLFGADGTGPRQKYDGSVEKFARGYPRLQFA